MPTARKAPQEEPKLSAEDRISKHAIAIRVQMKTMESLLQSIEESKQTWERVSLLDEVRRLLGNAISQLSPD